MIKKGFMIDGLHNALVAAKRGLTKKLWYDDDKWRQRMPEKDW